MYNSLMDHIRSLDIMLDKDSDKIKDLSNTNVSLTTKLDKLNESHEELAKMYILLVESNNDLLDMPCSSSGIDIFVTPCSPLCNELSIVKTNLARENKKTQGGLGGHKEEQGQTFSR